MNNFNALAPNITGIARKNVNSAATPRDTPSAKAPTIVAPDRDVPGIIAIIWKTPIRRTVGTDNWDSFVTLGSLFALIFSMTMNKIPYRISINATTYALLIFASIQSFNNSPTIIAGSVPIITLIHNWIVIIFCFCVFVGENGFSLWK